MDIKVLRHEDDYECCIDMERMDVDGEMCLSVANLCECPEDATIERDLINCSQVVALMRKAYEAGKRQEAFSVEVELTKEDMF